jgi:hypothetical protein
MIETRAQRRAMMPNEIRPGAARANVRSLANAKAARREKRNGRDVIVVPSATMPDDVVMNGVRYPAAEIAKSYMTLNRTPAPLGHPTVEGGWVSASDPEGLNRSWVGAWNENPRRENGRILLDKVIDVEVANRSEGGKAVLAAVESASPIHTSTGIYLNLAKANGDDPDGAEFIASDLHFDHDAILLGEDGAATPEQGVGIFVNSQGGQVINSRVDWAEERLSWAAEDLMDAANHLNKAKAREARLPAIIEALRRLVTPGADGTASEAVHQEEPMDDQTKERLNALETKVDGLGEAIASAVANAVKPLIDAQEAAANAAKAAEKAERDTLTNAIVKAGLRDEDELAHLPVANLRRIAEGAKPGKAAPIANGAAVVAEDDEFAGYSLNAHLDSKEA